MVFQPDQRRRRLAKFSLSNLIVAVAAIVLIGLARPALAQGDFEVKRLPDGTISITGRASGRSTSLTPQAQEPAQTESRPVATPLANRDSQYDALIVEHARANNVRPDLVRAVVTVESAFNPLAHSPKGAMGLMQLMPATARQFNVTNPYDPEQNIRAGSAYLRQLLDRYDGNEGLALAAYNAGPGAVDKYGQNIPPYRETRNYVDKVSGIAADDEEAVVTPTTKFYTVIEVIDGKEVVTYTTRKPVR